MAKLAKKNPDEVAYMIEVDDDNERIRLTLVSGSAINPEMFLQALLALVEDYEDKPGDLFQESLSLEYDSETH